VGWIDVAQKDKWWGALVTAVMNLGVPIRCRNFLSKELYM